MPKPPPEGYLGTIAVNEEICFIYRIELSDGRLFFHARSLERKTSKGTWVEDFIVYAPDGTVVLVAKVSAHVGRRKDGYLLVTLPVSMGSSKVGEEPARPRH